MKKLVSFVLILLINFFTTVPVLAETNEFDEKDSNVFSACVLFRTNPSKQSYF